MMRTALLVLLILSTGSAVSAQTPQTPVPVTTRDNDSVLNGALIGAGVGVASGLLLCRTTEPWENCIDDAGPMLRTGAIGAGVGIAIDLLIRGRKTIYVTDTGSAQLSAAPLVGRRAGGVQVSLNF